MPEVVAVYHKLRDNFTILLLSKNIISAHSSHFCHILLNKGGHIALSDIFHPSQHFTTTPYSAKCGHHHYQQNIHRRFHPVIHESTLYQASHSLSGGKLPTTPSNSLNTKCWYHQLFYFLQGWCNFPGN